MMFQAFAMMNTILPKRKKKGTLDINLGIISVEIERKLK